MLLHNFNASITFGWLNKNVVSKNDMSEGAKILWRSSTHSEQQFWLTESRRWKIDSIIASKQQTKYSQPNHLGAS